MNLKPSKMGFEKENHESITDYVHCCVISCHGNSMLHLV